MTLDYASPEQVSGETVGTASDVYSLGCVLYRLLCGHTPFDVARVAPAEAVRRVCETPPPPPPGLDRDLRAIILHAMEKHPEQRYHSVDELRADLARYLDGESVIARGPDRYYRMRKWLARHWIPSTAIVAVVLATTAGLAISVTQARRADQARRLADSERERAEASAREARAAHAIAVEKGAEAEREKAKAQRNLEAARDVAASLTRIADAAINIGDT